jgi:excisionase family DNA binding protein
MRHQLYSTEILAELLKVSSKTLNREREEGKINFIRMVGGKVYFRESDVFAYLDSLKTRKRQMNSRRKYACQAQ